MLLYYLTSQKMRPLLPYFYLKPFLLFSKYTYRNVFLFLFLMVSMVNLNMNELIYESLVSFVSMATIVSYWLFGSDGPWWWMRTALCLGLLFWNINDVNRMTSSPCDSVHVSAQPVGVLVACCLRDVSTSVTWHVVYDRWAEPPYSVGGSIGSDIISWPGLLPPPWV